MPTTPAKTPKPTGPQQVQTFLEQLEHPFKREIKMVRNIILKANPQLTEHIKWKAPSFCFNGDDRITFNLQGKGIFRLIFHCGAKVIVRDSQERLMHDTTGLLDWITNDRAVVTFTGKAAIEAKEAALTELVNKVGGCGRVEVLAANQITARRTTSSIRCQQPNL